MDPFKILGLTHLSTDEEIKRAYREKCTLYHPDLNKNPNAERKMKLINSAYDQIRTSELKNKYIMENYGDTTWKDFRTRSDKDFKRTAEEAASKSFCALFFDFLILMSRIYIFQRTKKI